MEVSNEKRIGEHMRINMKLEELDLYSYFVNIYPPNKGTYAM